MTPRQMRRLVDEDIERLGSRAQLARELGMSSQQLTTSLNDGRPIPDRIARRYGYRAVRTVVVRYEPL